MSRTAQVSLFLTLILAATAPSELSLLGRLGAHESWARTTDRSARTRPAREAMDAKFLDEADGDPIRAEHLRKAYFTRLALKSAQARRNKVA